MLGTDTACLSKGGAAFRLAHLRYAVTAMPVAISFLAAAVLQHPGFGIYANTVATAAAAAGGV